MPEGKPTLAKLNKQFKLSQILLLNTVRTFESHASIFLLVTFTQQPLTAALPMQSGCVVTVNRRFWTNHL